MDRTLRAVLLAVAIAFISVAGIGWFLGFGTGGSLASGVVVGLLSGALLWGVSRRADSFHPLAQAPTHDAEPDHAPDEPSEPDDPDGRAPR